MTAPSGARSGKHGFVNGVSYVRNWSLNWNRALEQRVHSATRAGTTRFNGVEDWQGSFEGFGGSPGLFPGDTFDMKLFAGPDDGVYGHTGKVWLGTAIVESLTINWNWKPSNSINWSVAFAACSCLDDEEGEYYDSGSTCAANMCDLKLEYGEQCSSTAAGTSITFGEWANLDSVTLTITAANQVVVNSSTNCCTLRRPGIIDWTLAVVDEEQYAIPYYDEPYAFRVYTTSLLYWELAYGLLQDISDIRCDIEGGSIVQKTNNFAMAGNICCPIEGNLVGVIRSPGAVDEWPVAASA